MKWQSKNTWCWCCYRTINLYTKKKLTPTSTPITHQAVEIEGVHQWLLKNGWHCLRNKLTFCNMHTFPSIMTDGGGVEIEQRHVNYFDILQERVKAWNNIVCRKKMKHIYNNLKRLCQAFLEFIHSTSWDLIELFRKRFVTIWVWKLTVPIFPRQDNRGLFDFDKLKWTVRAQLNDK